MNELKGKKVLVFAGPLFEDTELTYPKYRFIEAGASVTVAGLGEKEYKGKHGTPIMVDAHIDELDTTGWDLVVVPGGYMPDKLRMNQKAMEIIRHTVKSGGIVSAICHGGWALVSADVIRDKTVTSYPGIKDDMTNAGARWVDEEVVVDGNIVTSRKPDDLPAFCREIIKLVSRTAVSA